MPQIGIITPAAPSSLPFLRESANGVKRALQNEPEWEATWVVEIDGTEVDLALVEDLQFELSSLLEGSNCVSVKVGEHGFRATAPVARSIAFYSQEAIPEWTLTLDADDILMPDTLRQMLQVIIDEPDVWYVAGGIIKSAPNESLQENATVGDGGEPWRGGLPDGMFEVPTDNWRYLRPLITTGRIPQKGILDQMERQKRFPVHAACACYRSSGLLEVGGWPGTPTGADAALLAAVSEIHSGWVLDEPLIAYRQHLEQNTRSQWFLRNRRITWEMIASRANRPNLKPNF